MSVTKHSTNLVSSTTKANKKAKTQETAMVTTTEKPKSAKPGTKDDSAKKAPQRAAHPLVGNADTKVYPFKKTPEDFDFDKHAGLKKKDFATDADYYDYKVAATQHQLTKWQGRAEEARTLGSKGERQKAKRLVKMQEKIAELRKQLEAQGVDVDALLKQ